MTSTETTSASSSPQSSRPAFPEPPAPPADSTATWREIVKKFQQPSRGRAIWQLVNTLGPYAGLWYLMHRALAVSYWLELPLAILAGLFVVRIFIIFHDCGHGSFFKSKTANDVFGFITGVLTLTPTTTGAGSTRCITPPPAIWTNGAPATFGP